MKVFKFTVLFIVLSLNSSGFGYEEYEVLFKKKKKVDSITKELSIEKKAPSSHQKPYKIVPKRGQKQGNLPEFYKKKSKYGQIAYSRGSSFKKKFNDLSSGSELLGTIYHWVIAAPGLRSPVIMHINFGRYKGARVLGDAQFEKQSKCIVLNFNKLIFKNTEYSLSAQGVSGIGHTCFKGTYHSRSFSIFSGSFISNFIASFYDSQIPENKDANGNVTRDKSVNSSLKAGATGGALEVGREFTRKLKNTPEWIEKRGPINIKAIILTRPIEL